MDIVSMGLGDLYIQPSHPYINQDRALEELVCNHSMRPRKQYRCHSDILALAVLFQQGKEVLMFMLIRTSLGKKKCRVELESRENDTCTVLDGVHNIRPLSADCSTKLV